METIEQSIGVALRALKEAQRAYEQGRLADARRLLRFASCEAEDASHALNATINSRIEA